MYLELSTSWLKNANVVPQQCCQRLKRPGKLGLQWLCRHKILFQLYQKLVYNIILFLSLSLFGNSYIIFHLETASGRFKTEWGLWWYCSIKATSNGRWNTKLYKWWGTGWRRYTLLAFSLILFVKKKKVLETYEEKRNSSTS